jgi:hypothetical protein
MFTQNEIQTRMRYDGSGTNNVLTCTTVRSGAERDNLFISLNLYNLQGLRKFNNM